MTYAQNRLKRKLENRALGADAPHRGEPIPGEKSLACLARIARRLLVRARRKADAIATAQMMASLRERRAAA